MSYVQHEYSKYIDPEFNFSNLVKYQNNSKADIVNSLKNARCNGGIMLEPRLQEYLKKKKYYKENGIKPVISLEEEFQITNPDRRILRAFVKGSRDIYQNKKYGIENQNKKSKKQYFPSKEFRNDKRVPKLKQPNMEKPPNMGMFAPDNINDVFYELGSYENPIEENYIMDSRDFPENITGYNIDDTRFDPRTDPYMDVSVKGEKKYDKHTSQYRIDPKKTYSKQTKPHFSEKSDMDIKNKVVIPNVSSNNKRSQTTFDYKMGPIKNDILQDRGYETQLIRGMPHHTKKSYGYRNPQEHYYQYIDDDFQNMHNTVEPWGARGGVSTRRSNKALAKQKFVREIMQ